MKLKELASFNTVIQESFVPEEFLMIIDSLSRGENIDNAGHLNVLALVVNYAKEHLFNAEHFRDIYEFHPSTELIEALKEMSKQDLMALAMWAKKALDDSLACPADDCVSASEQDTLNFIKFVLKKQD